MRSDMMKCVQERPRYKGRSEWRDWRSSFRDRPRFDGEMLSAKEAEDYLPRRVQIKMRGKDFSDCLGPLKHWIRKQIGRPWDDIYSEIKRTLGGDSMTSRHALGHIDGWVRGFNYSPYGVGDEVRMIDGKPYNMVSFEWGGSVFLDGCYWVRTEGFYICPLSGVLKYEKKAAKRKDNPFSGVVGLSLREIDSMLAEARRSGKWPKFGPIPNTHPEKKTLDSHTLLRGWLFGWKRVKVKGEYVNARIYNEKKECIGRKKTWVPPKIEWIPHECTDGKGPCIVDENVRVRLRA